MRKATKKSPVAESASAEPAPKGSKPSILKSIDIYGQPVQLVYKGESKFRTFGGGIMTILTFVLFALAFYVKFSYHYLNDYGPGHQAASIRRLQEEAHAESDIPAVETTAETAESDTTETTENEEQADGAPTEEGSDSSSSDFFSPKNFKYFSYEEMPLDPLKFDEPINAKEAGVERISLILNQ